MNIETEELKDRDGRVRTFAFGQYKKKLDANGLEGQGKAVATAIKNAEKAFPPDNKILHFASASDRDWETSFFLSVPL